MNATEIMKLSEFEKLLSSKDWTRCYDVETTDIYGDGIKHPGTRVCGLGEVESSHGNIIIVYSECYEYVSGDKDSFFTSTEWMDACWELYGVTIVDGDGKPIDFDFGVLPSEFSSIDYELVKSSI